MNLTTSTAISPEFQTFYDKTLLNRLRQKYIHRQWAQKKPMPKNHGKTVQFRRFGNLAPATTPLTEGVTPAGNSASVTEITATIAQYGDYLMFSDMVKLTALDPSLVEYAEVLGDQAGETLDVLTRDELASGTNVFYAGANTARNTIASTDVLTLTLLKKVRRFFKKNKVKPMSDGYYVLLISPDTEYDLYADPDFKAYMQNRTDVKTIYDGEIGTVFGFRIIVTPNAKVFTGAGNLGVDVHASIALGADAYGEVSIEGNGNVQNIIKPLGSSGTEDALNQRQTTGWKVNAWTVKRLQELAICRIEHGVSA